MGKVVNTLSVPTPTPEDVFAIVISFNGGANIQSTVAALLPQVARVHLVDNGSDAETAAVLAELSRRSRVTVDFLGTNRGIGGALNAAIERGRREGFDWFLTMDQDSTADAGMVAALCAEVERAPDLRCLTPSISNFGAPPDSATKDVPYAITSGNLVHSEVLTRTGGYNEALFIDAVDFDFSLRVRAGGFRIRRVGDAVLHHRLGEQSGRTYPRGYTQHSPLRRYYMFRNLGSVLCAHAVRFPGFAVKFLLSHLVLLALIPIYDPAPARSFRCIMLGVWDFMRGVRGRKEWSH